MLPGCLFLLIVGAGTWSLDANWSLKKRISVASNASKQERHA
jgi:hypothetical protein